MMTAAKALEETTKKFDKYSIPQAVWNRIEIAQNSAIQEGQYSCTVDLRMLEGELHNALLSRLHELGYKLQGEMSPDSLFFTSILLDWSPPLG